jgi:hypothetical protein
MGDVSLLFEGQFLKHYKLVNILTKYIHYDTILFVSN